ncbi:MAG: sigma-E processing peptidase SpoIIGA [Clostridia bacterium]|nr:sigma-E processing peptidase SpoIIGA [Clostridia bacterium]
MGTYPIKVILTAGIVGFIIITTSFKNIKGKLTKKDMYCKIKVNINSKYTYINAIIDTGNFLREPITKIPVVVVEKDTLKYIIPNYILDNLNEIINGEDIDLNEYTSKIKIIPFTSLRKRKRNIIRIKGRWYIN